MPQSNPFKGLVDFSGDLQRMRRLGKTGSEHHYERYERTQADAWVPATDIFCRGADLFICLEVAGLSRDDVDVTFSQGTLTVSGERTTSHGEADDAFWQRERPHGAFQRSLGLPEQVEANDISAVSKDGLLTVKISGACESAGVTHRRIPITGDPR